MFLISLSAALLVNKDEFFSKKNDRTSSYLDNLLRRLNALPRFFLPFPSALLSNGKCNLSSANPFSTAKTYLR